MQAGVGLLRITKLVVPHRMPKIRVPDIVRPNYPDASPHNGPITKLPCHLRNAINVIINGRPTILTPYHRSAHVSCHVFFSLSLQLVH